MEAQITLQAVKLTKARVSSIIKWSSSRHNEITKPRVVADILLGFSQGGIWMYVDASQPLPDGITKTRPLAGEGKYREGLVEKRSYDSGTYCPGSSMSRYGTYEVDFAKKQILDVENSILYQFTSHNC